MGDNITFDIWEHQIITLYNADALTPIICDIISGSYKGGDLDSGNYPSEETKDGKTLDKVIVGLYNPNSPYLIDNTYGSGYDEDAYPLWREFKSICRERWGWEPW